MSENTPDEKVAFAVVMKFKESKLILDSDSKSIQEALSKGNISSETWTRFAEKAIDDTKKGASDAK